MNVGFAGTPAFAATVLAALVDAGFDVPLVLTQPDRPQGRGLRQEPSPVKRLALDRGIPVAQPASLAGDAARAMLVDAGVDVLAVAAYGLLLPQAILSVPREGCINVHASLLPRWRGAAPIERAILAGDTKRGDIMQMDAGLDTGSILCGVQVASGA
jgi:methionyl-tRNA formyltransferase